MRDVAVVAFAQLPNVRRDSAARRGRARPAGGQPRRWNAPGSSARTSGFTVSGSCDYLLGRPFSFVTALDGVGPWPPISESHVEMDGAWALYEAWVRLQHGDIDTALVYAYGKSSQGELRDVLVQQLDPYYLAPLCPDSVSLAALQARALIDSGRASERALAVVAARSRQQALKNPAAQLKGSFDVDALAWTRRTWSRRCAATIARRSPTARPRWCSRPARPRGSCRGGPPGSAASITASSRTRSGCAISRARRRPRSPAKNAGVRQKPPDLAELHAPFTHQELILRDALALEANTPVNLSGGALAANPVMVAGLARIGEAAQFLLSGEAQRAVAHATSGPCLQQNLVCVLEAE